MNHSFSKAAKQGFSLIETVIAIGVLAVLLSGFLVVFAPAAAGIRKSLNSQDAGRLVATLEQELVTLRGNEVETVNTGFDKAFYYIQKSDGPSIVIDNALLVYKYRASLTENSRSDDGTPEAVEDVQGLVPGEDYVVQNMMRRLGDGNFDDDLDASEGPIYLVKCNQLVLREDAQSGEKRLMLGDDEGVIVNVVISSDGSEELKSVSTPDEYNHAVITFKADFYALPTKSLGYFSSPEFEKLVLNAKRPVFSRNLAIRR